MCFSDVDECASSPCNNGGTCLNLVNKYQCNCLAGFNGTTCNNGTYNTNNNNMINNDNNNITTITKTIKIIIITKPPTKILIIKENIFDNTVHYRSNDPY